MRVVSVESSDWLRNPPATNAIASADQAAKGNALKALEGTSEVGEEVVCILTPYGEPQQSWGDPGGRELLVGELAVARRRRMGDDCVDAAETRRPPAELEVVHERLARLTPPRDLEGQHPSGGG